MNMKNNIEEIIIPVNLAPIVLFVYNRLNHTQQTIEALKQNIFAKESELFIYSDAPNNEESKKKVMEVRKYIKTISGFKNVVIIEREKNWGLAKSIIDGVTNIVNDYGKIIVLEDDLITSPYFLKYMNDSLSFYQDKKEVWEIGGYVYPIDIEKEKNTYFMPFTTSWGWATWDDRWIHFERDPIKLVDTFSKKDIKRFNFDNCENVWNQVLRNYNGELYTWAIFWYAIIFLNKGLTVYPYKSMVKNIGHDGSGENCGTTNEYSTKLLREEIIVNNKNIKVDEKIYDDVKKYFKKKKISIVGRILNKLRRLFK